MAAFGFPTIDSLQRVASSRIDEIERIRGPHRVPWEYKEELDWLIGLVTNVEPMDWLRRVSVSTFSPSLGMLFLPFLMTVETDTRWRLGRGVKDCGLYSLGTIQGALVQTVVLSGSASQVGVVCQYVSFCAECFEDLAIPSWDHYWKDVCSTTEPHTRRPSGG